MTRTDKAAEVGLHVFERAGLGKAPFRCIGVTEQYIRHHDGTTQASGCCQYCGMGIRYVYKVVGVDRKPFNVGCDCVERTGDAGLIRSYKNRPEVRAMARAKRKLKDESVIAEWKALFEAPDTVAKLTAVMVPGRPWVPGEQISLHQRFKELWRMCGAAGRGRTLKALKARLQENCAESGGNM